VEIMELDYVDDIVSMFFLPSHGCFFFFFNALATPAGGKEVVHYRHSVVSFLAGVRASRQTEFSSAWPVQQYPFDRVGRSSGEMDWPSRSNDVH
jgi:hypothetical protein